MTLNSLASLRFVVRTAITPPRVIAARSTQFARTARQALSRPGGPRRLGDCVGCGRAVTSEDPYLRYRGDYYHADNCVESDPPALRQAGRAAQRGRS
jgi:hypothetical protein